jgi:cobalt-zinc-cadmium efflux system outer membrane protein
VPDLSLGAGVRHLADVPGTGFVASASVPLPLWSRSAGLVAAAESERSAAESRARGTELRLREELRSAADRRQAALDRWSALRSQVQPAAEEALRSIVSGYRAGRLTYLDIQDGQRALFEAELLLVEAAAEAWRWRTAIALLVGETDGLGAPGGSER